MLRMQHPKTRAHRVIVEIGLRRSSNAVTLFLSFGGEALDAARVFDFIVTSAAGAGADVCELWLCSSDRVSLSRAATRQLGATRFPEDEAQVVTIERLASGLLEEALQQREPQRFTRAAMDAKVSSADPLAAHVREQKAVSVLMAPIAVDQQPGALLVLIRNQAKADPFTEADANLIAAVASLASAALEKIWTGIPSVPLRVIINNLPAMVAYWDVTLRCRFANRAYERSFGVAQEALLGRAMPEILGADFPLHAPYIKKVLQGEPQEFERETQSPLGGPPGHSQALYIPHFIDGEVHGFCVLVIDISQRKQAESEAARAMKQTEAANRDLETFSYTVAHDLRAPLRGMSGFAALLLRHYGNTLNTEANDWLNEILQGTEKMAELINALLDLARLQRGPIKRERVNIASLARNEIARLAAAEPTRQVEVVLDPEVFVYADPSLARALVCNLIDNAWKFTRSSARARIEVARGDAQQDAGFMVRDNGAGFDMAFAAKLFAPFQRLHTVDEFPGSGVGLATVQRIVQRHGGEVRGEGAVGRGATFYVSLPRPKNSEA